MNQVAQKVRQSPLLMGAIIIVGIIGIAAAWWLGSPLFLNTRVDEAFPIVATQVVNASPTQVATAVTSAEVANPRDSYGSRSSTARSQRRQIPRRRFVP